MTELKRILVPVDFSETSFNALETAAVLAQRNDASLDIVYARDTIPELVMAGGSQGRLKENSHAIMNAYVTAIEHRHKVKPEIIWEEGLPAEAIIRTAKIKDPDLIVCGTHGASGYRDAFIGSTAYTIIKYATCPVLTIPAGPRRINFRKLLLPLRPIHGALRNLDIVLNIASENGQLHVLDLSGNNQDDRQLISYLMDELKERLDEGTLKTSISNSPGYTIPDKVFSLLNHEKFDIVVITPSLDMTNKQLYIGPHTQKIINQSSVPILTIKRFA